MEDRARRIAEAAYDVISKYGIRRTTMSDVAEAAGVSRQTLYNVFPKREALLVEVVRHHFFSKWATIDAALAGAEGRSGRFDVLLNTLVIETWHSIQAMPHADELELEMATTIKQELAAIHAAARDRFCSFLEPYDATLNARGMTARGLGDLLHHSIMGLKLSSLGEAEIRNSTAAMHACLMAVTEPVA